ncbi:hypothetical protein [Soonwooa sp.]|uniref:hypothetical protein n=1 Tax=Soonwooa sp. TaxID=1938592 RepID=UPI0028AF0B60|nr:hypothetical protein [Soonwooa sp.]
MEIDRPFKNGNTIQLQNLPKGLYILKTKDLNTKFIVEYFSLLYLSTSIHIVMNAFFKNTIFKQA